MIDEIDHLEGDIGGEVPRIVKYMKQHKLDHKDPDLWEQSRIIVHDQYLATQFIIKSDPKRYAPLVAHMQNKYTAGQDQYPANLNSAYLMLVNYVNPS